MYFVKDCGFNYTLLLIHELKLVINQGYSCFFTFYENLKRQLYPYFIIKLIISISNEMEMIQIHIN